MSINLRKSGAADRGPILELMAAARGDGLTDAQRAERGFVQGAMDEDLLAKFQEDTGVFLAEEETTLVGFAMTSLPGAVAGGPPMLALDALRDNGFATERLFLYGPTAVDERYQGRGILSMLLRTLSRELADRFDLGVAFVEEANARSLAVHRHYGMTEAADFTFRDRPYRVFTFAPAAFASRGE